MLGLETERLRLRCLENGWEIVPRSLEEPVGTILFEWSEIKGFVSPKLKIDEGWRHGFLGEALIAIFGFFFKENDTVCISADGKVYHKELLECGMRPQIRGEIDKGYRIYKVEFENGACDKAF